MDAHPTARAVVGVVGSLLVVTTFVAALETWLGVEDASAAYLVAVVVCALAFGSWAAVTAAVGAFLVYDFLFVAPTLTFTVHDPSEWVTLLLLLGVGVVVGQLAAAQRERALTARAREREALALFRVSRTLATRPDTIAVLPGIAAGLRTEAGMERVWISMVADPTARGAPEDERVVADTGTGPRVLPARQAVLRRMPGDMPAQWVDTRAPTPGRDAVSQPSAVAYRVRIEAASETVGSIWGLRDRSLGRPDPTATRLLSAAADQLGQTLVQDRLGAEAREAEVARQSDSLKSALLESVSHDLRTPLASIRAAAGTLRDPAIELDPEERIGLAAAIDREAEYLARLVSNLLDLSRIEAGALKPDLEVYEPLDIVERTLDRLRPTLDGRSVEVRVPTDLPPVTVDAVYMDEILTNLLENARKYVPSDRPVRVAGTAGPGDRQVTITVEDGGAGVTPSALPRLFDKFFRVRAGSGSRPGTGIGLAVVRGLVEAMGGTVAARRSELGGLAVDLLLVRARGPAPREARGSHGP
jgi:two-component system sensor histidine kinase KdpD